MRIAFDVSYVQNRCTGIGRASRNLLASLLSTDRRDKFLLHGWSWSLDLHEVKSLCSDDVVSRCVRIPGPLRRFYWDRLRSPRIERIIGDFDVFHSADPFSPPTAKRTIVTVHDLISFRHPEWFEPSVLARHKRLLASVRNADVVVVPSQHTCDAITSLVPSCRQKTTIVHWQSGPNFAPVDKEGHDGAVLSRWNVSTPYILFVGTIEPRKNLSMLLKAYDLYARGSSQSLSLVLVGKQGWKSGPVLEEIESLQRRARLRYLQYAPLNDLASLYRNAHAFVYPSLEEGFGLPVLEALASGTIAVTSDVSAMAELWKGCALLVDPTDADAIADGLRRAVEDSIQRAALRKEWHLRAKDFDGGTSAQKFISLYNSLA